jgi:hypothetical protein
MARWLSLASLGTVGSPCNCHFECSIIGPLGTRRRFPVDRQRVVALPRRRHRRRSPSFVSGFQLGHRGPPEAVSPFPTRSRALIGRIYL